jgi:hypothetical protein
LVSADKIKKQCFCCRYTESTVNEYLLMCSALDPRFKKLPFLPSDVERDEVWNKIAECMVDLDSVANSCRGDSDAEPKPA